MLNKLFFLILILLLNINNKNGVKYNICYFGCLNSRRRGKNKVLFLQQFNQAFMPIARYKFL